MDQSTKTLEELIHDLTRDPKQNGWESHRIEKEKEIAEICQRYAEYFNYTPEQVFLALERNRTYSYPNYYQEANFPKKDAFDIYQNHDELREALKPELGFRCPSCKGISTDPYECSQEECDWKSYGFLKFGLYKFTIAENWILKPFVDEIFPPIAFEEKPDANGHG